MTKGRIEAFSDGVLAIIITIMVLELKVPHGADWRALAGLWPVFLSYVLSFLNVGIYWNNHHHMFQAVRQVGGWVLWANLHLLFWLSLVPFTTAFLGENHFAGLPMLVYVADLLMCGLAYFLLERALMAQHGAGSDFASVRSGNKDRISLAAYLVALALAFVNNWLALLVVLIVSLIWIVPDRRFSQGRRAE
jgi:uncharacterized membrane protein